MDTREFLQLVTPDGLRCITLKGDKGLVQMPARTAEEAERLITWVDGQERDCHFALASFREEFVNDNGKRRVRRKKANVDQLKALWVDIDFKDAGPLPDVLTALEAFYDETGFPKASIVVHSGNGVHLYWPLSEPVSREAWQALVHPFKDLCKQSGLPADHACTSDSARVLRPIGTHNWKDAGNPKPVRFLGGSGCTFAVDDLRRVLQAGTVVEGDTKGADQALPAHLRAAVAQAGPGR